MQPVDQQPNQFQQAPNPTVTPGGLPSSPAGYPPVAGQPPAQNPQAPQGTKPIGTPPKKTEPQNTTQKSLLFSELRDGMIIMSDGSFRAVVACESINFDLMSSREREGVEYSYQNFLNSLTFDIQVFIRSQRVDIAPYLDKLEAIRRSQDNMLLGVLMDDYITFIDQLAEEANIMDKSFFVVVPYFPAGDAAKLVEKGKGFFSKFAPAQPQTVTKIDQATYQKAKDEIKNRVDSVISGLSQVGVRCAPLNTKELGELYYNVYNPDTAVNQPLGDFRNTTATYVRKGEGEVSPQSLQKGEM